MRVGLRVLMLGVGVSVALPLVASRPFTAVASDEVQLQFADLLFAEGQYLQAVSAYRRAVQADDPILKLRASKGLVTSLLRIGEFDEARDEAATLRSLAPADAAVLALCGDALWAAALFQEAEQLYEEALAVDPGAPRARHGRARARAAQSRFDEAIEDVQAALRRAPDEAEFHHTLGAIYERLGRFDEAAASMTNYVNLLPRKETSDKAAWARAQVRFLRSFEGKRPLEVDQPHEQYVIPFRLIRDKVTVSGRVNGGRWMNFVVDTGSEQTVLSVSAARRTGVLPITYVRSAGVGQIGLRGLQVGRIDSLQIGGFKIKNIPCLIKNPPLMDMPTRETESFSPLALGFSMVIDYEKKLLHMGRHLPVEEFDTELPLRMHRLAMVRGTVNGSHPASFVVDTGGEVISISQSTAGALRTDPSMRRIPLKVYGTSGWDPDAFLLPGVDLAFKSLRFTNIPVVVLNLDTPSALLGFQVGGIVGHRFLSQYRVAIDLQRSVVRLKTL